MFPEALSGAKVVQCTLKLQQRGTTNAEVERFGLDTFRALAFSFDVRRLAAGLVVFTEQIRHVVVLLGRHLHQPVVGRLQRLPDLVAPQV